GVDVGLVHPWSPWLAWAASAYVLVQLLAALVAATLRGLLVGHDPERTAAAARAVDDPVFQGAFTEGVAEFLGTYFMAFVILMVATSRRTAGNGYFGFAIALAVYGAAAMFEAPSPDLQPCGHAGGHPARRLRGLHRRGKQVDVLKAELAFVGKFAPRYLCMVGLQLTPRRPPRLLSAASSRGTLKSQGRA
ncbi:hypothetical protein EMGBD4_05260, partial [Verrucomicrobiota bacterium]